jgi:uncharacterized spore protein YtfJ
MSIQQLLESVAQRVSAGASVKNVYGDPVVAGDRTVIPIARLRYAFGGGSGGPRGNGEISGGGGGRVSAGPCGALEVTPHGARFIAFDDRRRTGAALAIGFLLGAAFVALTRTRRIETAKRAD